MEMPYEPPKKSRWKLVHQASSSLMVSEVFFWERHAVVMCYGVASSDQLARLALGHSRKDSKDSVVNSSSNKGKLPDWPAFRSLDANLSEQAGRRFQKGRLPASRCQRKATLKEEICWISSECGSIVLSKF